MTIYVLTVSYTEGYVVCGLTTRLDVAKAWPKVSLDNDYEEFELDTMPHNSYFNAEKWARFRAVWESCPETVQPYSRTTFGLLKPQ